MRGVRTLCVRLQHVDKRLQRRKDYHPYKYHTIVIMYILWSNDRFGFRYDYMIKGWTQRKSSAFYYIIKYDSVDGYLYATFSKRFIIRNMKPAERRQSTIKTDHTIVRGMSFHKKPPTLTSRLPIAVATNHPPIIVPLYFGGATLLTKLIPIRTKQQLHQK